MWLQINGMTGESGECGWQRGKKKETGDGTE